MASFWTFCVGLPLVNLGMKKKKLEGKLLRRFDISQPFLMLSIIWTGIA